VATVEDPNSFSSGTWRSFEPDNPRLTENRRERSYGGEKKKAEAGAKIRFISYRSTMRFSVKQKEIVAASF